MGEAHRAIIPLNVVRICACLFAAGSRIVLVAALVATAFIGVSQAAQAAAQPDPIDILLRAQKAARELDYSGVYTYQQGAAMLSNRVVHIVDGTGERELLELLDGPPREFVRHNETIKSLIPERKLVVVEERRGDRFPGLLIGDGSRLAKYYTATISPSPNRIAGRECRLIELSPDDGYRYGYRFYVDVATNLLVKTQTVNAAGELIAQTTFTSLQVGKGVSAEQLQPQWDSNGWQVIENHIGSVDLASEGWRIALPPGFEAIAQVTRPGKAGEPVKQLVMSDGLAAISIFLEPFDAQRHHPTTHGPVRRGALNIYSVRMGDHWITALGEVPAKTLHELAERTQYVPLAVAR